MRRILAALAALVLALVGTVVLVAYVRGADARALAGVQTVSVLVVDQAVPAGTPGDQLADLVRAELLPAKAVAPGSVTDLAELAGLVATVDLQPGEPLLAARFAAPDELRAAGTVDVPPGDQELSVLLEPQRAVGGRLAAGDTVGVYVSIEGSTHAVLHGVLVTQVQGAPAAAVTETAASEDSGASAPPSQSLMITFAVTAEEAEPIVFGMEHGTVWLSLEPDGADTSGTTVISPGNVYTEVYQ
ncbi:Flp pilus assembly protein CpaB [Geodermatophilus sp. URMC 64]